MKRRCICPKPDYIVMDFPVGRYPLDLHYNVYGWEGSSPILHFKPADRECERCGRPLCKDCQVQQLKTKGIKQTSLHFTWFEAEYVTRCSVCAKEAI